MTSRATKPILSIHRCHFSGFLAQYEPLEKTLFSHPCPPRHETWQSLLLSPNLLAITKGTSENYVNANVSGCLTKFISKMPIFCDASGIRLYRLQVTRIITNLEMKGAYELAGTRKKLRVPEKRQNFHPPPVFGICK